MTLTHRADTGAASDKVWTPSPEYLSRSRLLAFCRHIGVAGRPELDLWSRENPDRFWAALVAWLGLPWQHEPTAMRDRPDNPAATRWFVGGSMNVFDVAVTRWVDAGRGGETALLWEDESGRTGRMTFRELHTEATRVATALSQLGVGFGDRVGVQLPMVVEAALVSLALAKIGAIAVPVFSGFGAGAVAERLRHSQATALVVADGVVRRARTALLRSQTREVLEAVPDVTVCVTVPVEGAESRRAGRERLPHEVTWAELLANGTGKEAPTAVCPGDHPLMIAFTSGTTGNPKGVTLGHAGFVVKAGSDAALLFDVGPGDVSCWVTDPGWIMHPITLLGGLAAGSAVAVLDGAPDHPRSTRLWESVQRLGITMLGVSPTLIRSLRNVGATPEEHMASLRVLASSGEPWTEDAYHWLFDSVGARRLPIINYSGGTEVSGGILTNTVAEPIRPSAFAGPIPGMGADLVDKAGASVARGAGELVLRLPSPGMPLGFWGEPGRYEATYWEQWPGTWKHGDWAEIAADGEWYIHGRSDNTLKIAGKRLGSAEVENIVNRQPGVVESAAIGIPDPLKGEALVVFARLDRATEDIGALRSRVSDAIVADLGKPLRPQAVHFVTDLPRTRSGKILRRVVRDVHLGHPVDAATASLGNPDSIDALRNLR
ncbi:AMP-binding protein [Micromonospora sp. NPDC007271]|uniref:AMP-binding protein n=1 Tax=Micromonospora sp. NPDC007271 TaxID=3154587 RepID=UPI0033C5D8EA